MPAHLARVGIVVFALLFAFALLAERPAAGRALVSGSDAPPLDELTTTGVTNVAVAGVEAGPSPIASVASAITASPVTTPRGAASAEEAVVLASWYGPGFYGNRTACGQVFTPEILGVAHLSLPCGTLVTLVYGARSITVPVIDRGPYVAGRSIDLSNATKLALGCGDLCTLRLRIAG
jgi:rare lipoprotein A (peptidoglycan hydrolase)